MSEPLCSIDEEELVRGLQAGNEKAFATLVDRHHQSLLRIARSFVTNTAVAEEVVQDTWMAVVRGISRFEGRSSLRSWLVGILVNRARTTGAREHRSEPIAPFEAVVDASRFDEGGHWSFPPSHFSLDIEETVSVRELIRSSLDQLPARQRQVVTLRDIEGLNGREVCDLLAISDGNQRILLHRGRTRLREELEAEFGRV